jgi:transposase
MRFGTLVPDDIDLTDKQLAVLEPVFPVGTTDAARVDRSAGRIECRVVGFCARAARGADLPRHYPSYQTCHRRFELLHRSGRLDQLPQRLTEDRHDRGQIDLSEAFVDTTFASAKKATGSVRRTAGNGSKIMAIVDRAGLPIALYVASASPYEPHIVRHARRSLRCHHD